MTNIELTVSGRQFRSREEYEAAERDAQYIEKIRQRYSLEKPEDVEALLKDLRTDKFRFRTILGQDFIDEIEEIADNQRKAEKNEGPKRKSNRKPGIKKTGKTGKTGKIIKQPALEELDADMQKTIKQELRKQEKRRRLVIFACMGVAAVCFGYLGIYYYQAQRNAAETGSWAALKDKDPISENIVSDTVITLEDGTVKIPEILDEYKNAYNKNKKLIGWVKIDDTKIDYPVMQTSNNEYYLDHNFNQESDKNGSIFLDKDCQVVNRSTNLIVYGHHMRSGAMFGQLNKYSSESFYEEHKYIQFDTIYEKGMYEIMYAFRSRIYEESEIVFKYYQFINANSETEFDSYMEDMAEMSLYDTGVTAEYGDELLTLSTCDYYTDYGRFVVVAKRID